MGAFPQSTFVADTFLAGSAKHRELLAVQLAPVQEKGVAENKMSNGVI